jgi:hypothetical protein
MDAIKAHAYGSLNISYKENEGVICIAKPGECRFLYPYNSHFTGKFWQDAIPRKECLEKKCPFILSEIKNADH